MHTIPFDVVCRSLLSVRSYGSVAPDQPAATADPAGRRATPARRSRARCTGSIAALVMLSVGALNASGQGIISIEELPESLVSGINFQISRDGSKMLSRSVLSGGFTLWDQGATSVIDPPDWPADAGFNGWQIQSCHLSGDGNVIIANVVSYSTDRSVARYRICRLVDGVYDIAWECEFSVPPVADPLPGGLQVTAVSGTGYVIGGRSTVSWLTTACAPLEPPPEPNYFNSWGFRIDGNSFSSLVPPGHMPGFADNRGHPRFGSADGSKMVGTFTNLGEGVADRPFISTAPGSWSWMPMPPESSNVVLTGMTADGSTLLGFSWPIIGSNAVRRWEMWVNGSLTTPPAPPGGLVQQFYGADHFPSTWTCTPDGALLLGVFGGPVEVRPTRPYFPYVWTSATGWKPLEQIALESGFRDSRFTPDPTLPAPLWFLWCGAADGITPGSHTLILSTSRDDPSGGPPPKYFRIVMGPPCAGIVEREWSGQGMTPDFSDSGNWTAGEPALGDNILARFVDDDIYAVHVDPASIYCEGYSVSAGDVTFDLGGGTARLDPGTTVCSDRSLEVARDPNETATVRIDGGTFQPSSNVQLGNGANSGASLLILSGATMRMVDAGRGIEAARGGESDASLTVQSGATLETPLVSLAEGLDSTATMMVHEGGDVSTDKMVLGAGTASVADVLIEDPSRGGVGGDTQFESDVLIVGEKGAGVMTVRGPGARLETIAATLGSQAGSSGTLTIDNSMWNHAGSGRVEIGLGGTGQVSLCNGAVWSHTGEGKISVGSAVPSHVLIESGSHLNVPAEISQANLNVVNGSLTVRGANSTIDATASVLSIGGATASMTLESGAAAIFSFGQFGVGAFAATVNLSGAGTSLSFVAAGALSGHQGLIVDRGTMTVSGGAQVASTLAAIATESGSTAGVTLSGAGTRWTNTEHIFVGWGPDTLLPGAGGIGSLTVSDSAVLQTDMLCIGASGTVTGAAIHCGIPPPEDRVAANGIYTQGLIISQGMVLDVPSVTFYPGAVLGGTGEWPGSFTNTGVLQPGGESGLGTLSIGGAYSQTNTSSMSIQFDLYYDEDDIFDWVFESDHLAVTGACTLGGVLSLSMKDENEASTLSALLGQGYIPTFEIVTAASVVGEFDRVDLVGFPVCRVELLYGATNVTVTIAPACPGDANGDGVIGFTDITAVLTNWGFSYPNSTGPGDSDHNGTVNFADITTVLENWGIACP